MSSRKLRFDGWVLDPESGDLERGGTRIRLQEHSVQVLLELITHAGSVVPREQLIARLWPKGVVDFDTGLNTVIRKLRSALGDTSDTPRYIETLPRRGYRFIGALDPDPEGSSAASAAVPVSTPSGASLGPAPPSHQEPTVLPEAGLAAPRAMSSGHEPAARDEATSSTAMSIAPIRRPRLPALALIGALAVAALLTGFYALWRARLGVDVTGVRVEAPSPSGLPANVAPTSAVAFSPPPHSIAVLPFADLSEKHDQEYFADGMAEEIIDRLAKVPDLRVPARTSSFYFKGRQAKVPDIARELSVANVLEGSVRTSGGRLRVTTQLVSADNGFEIWSQTYDRDLHDVFSVQDDIANSVVQALQIKLMGGPLTRQQGGTQNLEAYQLYLRASHDLTSNSRSVLETARGYLEKAIKLDPDFGLAWTSLAVCSWNLVFARALPRAEGFERSRQLAQHALELSPGLANAHWVIGYVHRTYDWDWASAEDEAQRALALDPRYWPAQLLRGQIAATLGHWDVAERQMRAGLDRDPLNPFAILNLANTLYRAGRYADAESWYQRLLEIAPNFEGTHEYLAKTLLAAGKPELALATLQPEPGEANRLDILSMVLYALGRKSEANAALDSLIEKFGDEDAYWVAMNYAYRNDHAPALQWLDRAYKQREPKLGIEIVGEPMFRNLTDDPGYKALLRKLNLPE